MAMVSDERWWRSGKVAAAVVVTAIHAIVGYALSTGKITVPAVVPDDALVVIDLKPPPPAEPPPPPPPPKPHEPAEQGGREAAPKAPPPPEIVAAPLPLPAPPPIIMTPPIILGGAAPAGAGGVGSGTGAGGTGSGTGRGSGDGGAFSDARQIRGRFRNSDFPASARGAGRVKIGVRYAVGPGGTVDDCEIIESSGYPEVDEMTCRVIVERYRFKPARDEEGTPVTKVMEEDYTWTLD